MFLLIPPCEHQFRFGGYPLHSNMFLLIRIHRSGIVTFRWPLHSNMFLLIRDWRKITSAPIFFTFQYVSINTMAGYIRASGALCFTFQYVSINTLLHTAVYQHIHYTLHSNMFLLIPSVTSSPIPESFLYIPICFY